MNRTCHNLLQTLRSLPTLSSKKARISPRASFAHSFSSRSPPHGRYDDPFQRMRQRPNYRTPSYQTPDHQARYQNARPIITPRGIKVWALIGSGGAIIFYFLNQETVPVSGRRRFNFVTKSMAEAQGLQSYNQILQSERAQGRILPDYDRRVGLVKRVLGKLIAGGDLGASGDGDNWEVYVIEDPGTQNAFVLPGNKVFVYSGILPICGGEDGLAAVLGHEIAHNIASHSAERMSSMLPLTLLSFGFIALDWSGITFGLPIGQYIGNTLLDLVFAKPAGRQQESEADFIGLLLMAKSCYDPRAAVGLWERMDKAHQDAPPEWLSTHPSNANRVGKIKEWLPEAEEAAQSAGCAVTAGFMKGFERALPGKAFW